MPSSVMLMLPAPPFIHHRSLQRVMQKSQKVHLVRRESSQCLNPHRSLDRLEMKELRGRLVI
jgi:hypothetical protein